MWALPRVVKTDGRGPCRRLRGGYGSGRIATDGLPAAQPARRDYGLRSRHDPQYADRLPLYFGDEAGRIQPATDPLFIAQPGLQRVHFGGQRFNLLRQPLDHIQHLLGLGLNLWLGVIPLRNILGNRFTHAPALLQHDFH